MSGPIPSTPTPGVEFQNHFGGSPGSGDVAGDCKKWEQLCGDLLAEREMLREELERTRTERDGYRKSLGHLLCKDLPPPPFATKEEMLANAVYDPPLEEFIESLNCDKEE